MTGGEGQPVNPFDATTCERLFHAALAAGDIRGVEAAVTVMTPQDPHRAGELLDMLRMAAALADSQGEPAGTP